MLLRKALNADRAENIKWMANFSGLAKSRAVEHDHPVILSREINQTARLEILDHAAIAVKENQRPLPRST